MHTVFYVSDGTAITAEVFGHAVLSQFPMTFEQVTIPFVGDVEKAQLVKAQIDSCFTQSGKRPLVFHTIVDTQLRNIITNSEAKCYDFLNTFVAPIEQQLGIKADPQVHRTHGMDNKKHYDTRIDAVNYALENDDGVTTKAYNEADIILVGVSRCGKTPTSLYLALQFGIRVANYPFIDQDMQQMSLPTALKTNRHKLFGLTIDAQRLQEIRQRRMADSQYSAAAQCRYELNQVEKLFRQEAIPFIDTTFHSVEEISVKILERAGIRRRIY
ncbi:posphoenolpyruvate synthetase regulatory kinase/phosphorylase PpsR [Oceanisphaera avium]|uniref:Putative phosphoenolpyruvate synthase regulatory protein n=1 Tax=Oceanisphaera avium TaxID=1903694 RepID=A0A1Y0CUU3_9GAMM|nr:pyruvate, water dikinase regulatory protein [Oceanisphaera avium]ART79111.1 phosphoenolpyruvate synthase regulatory protein [Oceanisphaera avium]